MRSPAPVPPICAQRAPDKTHQYFSDNARPARASTDLGGTGGREARDEGGHQIMTDRRKVLLQDGRAGKIVRIDTDFPRGKTEPLDGCLTET